MSARLKARMIGATTATQQAIAAQIDATEASRTDSRIVGSASKTSASGARVGRSVASSSSASAQTAKPPAPSRRSPRIDEEASAAASAAQPIANPSCDTDAICASDIGRQRTTNSHGAAPPASAIEAAPRATLTTPPASLARLRLCVIDRSSARPAATAAAAGR